MGTWECSMGAARNYHAFGISAFLTQDSLCTMSFSWHAEIYPSLLLIASQHLARALALEESPV